jgi:hypothetical protein
MKLAIFKKYDLSVLVLVVPLSASKTSYVYQESIKSRHLQLHYELKLYMFLQGSKYQTLARARIPYLKWFRVEGSTMSLSLSLMFLVQLLKTCSTTAIFKIVLCYLIRCH